MRFLEGSRAGMWMDFATGEGGDIFDAWARVMGIDATSRFPELVESVAQWLGVSDSKVQKSHAASLTENRHPTAETLYPLQYHIDIHKLSAFRGYHGNPTFQ
jgi:hypothetical protein